MANNNVKKTVVMALAVCLCCAILVSTTVIVLKKIERKNRQKESMVQILKAGNIDISGGDIQTLYQKHVKPIMIEISTGRIINQHDQSDLPDIQTFDIKKISRMPRFSQAIAKKKDLAGLKRIPKYMIIYQLRAADSEKSIILPIHGKGLWSTMYGYLALDAADIRRIQGITFYEHGETPGLGGEIDNRQWQMSWQGKKALNEKGEVLLEVKKGKADPGSSTQVDGLSGATITSRGVNDMVKFWLGTTHWETGYGPVLKKIMEKQDNDTSKETTHMSDF